MSEWPMVKLGEVCSISIGKTPARKEPRYWGEGLPWLSIKDMNQGSLILKTTESISQIALDELKITPYSVGTVLFSFKLSIGKVGITAVPLFTNEAIAAIEPKEQEALNKYYLMEVLREVGKTVEGNAAVMGVTLNKKSLAKLTIPLPPLGEQKRIAEMLGEASKTIKDTENTIHNAQGLKRSALSDILNNKSGEYVQLSQISSVQSGITKGRKVQNGITLIPTPYMAVSNVKAGYLDLSEVKQIDASEAEVNRYQLQAGDILLTEGGDPDKLGRGTIWRNEIPGAIHQNHIFRVRINPDSGFTSEALMAILESAESKGYFLRSAKQTTGISSINKRQLSATPIPVLGKVQIEELTNMWHKIDEVIELYRRKLSLLQELQKSLATRAFAGLL